MNMTIEIPMSVDNMVKLQQAMQKTTMTGPTTKRQEVIAKVINVIRIWDDKEKADYGINVNTYDDVIRVAKAMKEELIRVKAYK